MRNVIIYGAGKCGNDALEWFSPDRVAFFVDNSELLQRMGVRRKEVKPFKELVRMYHDKKDFAERYDIVVAVKDKWVVHQIAGEMDNRGILQYSIFDDITHRWNSAIDFLNRNVNQYSCEIESLNAIYIAQNKWLLRHTNPTAILPAVGRLREKQLENLQTTVKIFRILESEIGIKPFMEAGTLLGAIRHKGYIPWDDDLDFGLIRYDFNILLDYLMKKYEVYELINPREDKWKKVNDIKSSNFAVYKNFGGVTIAYNERNRSFYENKMSFFVDIASIDTLEENCTLNLYQERIADLKNKIEYATKKGDINISGIIDDYYIKNVELSSIPNSRNMLCRSIALSASSSFFASPGRCFNTQMYEYGDVFPMQKLEFEGEYLYAPANTNQFMAKMYGDTYMELPRRYGVYVHNKDAVFSEVY